MVALRTRVPRDTLFVRTAIGRPTEHQVQIQCCLSRGQGRACPRWTDARPPTTETGRSDDGSGSVLGSTSDAPGPRSVAPTRPPDRSPASFQRPGDADRGGAVAAAPSGSPIADYASGRGRGLNAGEVAPNSTTVSAPVCCVHRSTSSSYRSRLRIFSRPAGGRARCHPREHYCAVKPPSITSSVPVTNFDSSEAR